MEVFETKWPYFVGFGTPVMLFYYNFSGVLLYAVLASMNPLVSELNFPLLIIMIVVVLIFIIIIIMIPIFSKILFSSSPHLPLLSQKHSTH